MKSRKILINVKIDNYDKEKNVVEEIVDYNSKYKDTSLNVKYGNGIFGFKKVDNIKLEKKYNIDTSKLKNYTLTYNIKYKAHKKKVKKIVKVVDREKPNIETDNVEIINVCPDSDKYNLEYKAIDNLDGDITDKVDKKLNENELVLSVSDSNKNKAIKKIKVEYKDIDKPTITLNGDTNITIQSGTTYTDLGASAQDFCDGDITANINVQNNVDTSKDGNYTVVYKVVDKAGNEENITRNVKVYTKVKNVSSGDKIIYLTFDDGPSKYTEGLLNVLSKYGAKVTFFVTNQYPNYAYLMKREHDEGHTVAIHSYTHKYDYIYSSLDNYFNDLNSMNEVIKQQTGEYSKIVRLPGGSSNTVSRKYSSGIMTNITNELTSRGYAYFDWNVSSGDAGATTSSSVVASNVIAGMKKGITVISLQHDTKQFSVNAVEQIIKEGQALGYTFKALDVNSYKVHQKINN